MQRSRSDKVIVLGVDGMDPRLTKRMVDQGKLPNIEQLIKHGSQREDLVLLGGMPTITPPMWTTLSTGAYPETHGITCFFKQSPHSLDKLEYGLDAHSIKAEQLWEVTAAAGKKTLVWHWPGGSWPPLSDNQNLHIVDGLTPSSINMIVQKESELIIMASTDVKSYGFKEKVEGVIDGDCVLDNLESDTDGEFVGGSTDDISNVIFTLEEGEMALEKVTFDLINSPIIAANGWLNAPDDAKEFVYYTSKSRVRRYGLILKNESTGIYDRVALYKSKQDSESIVILDENTYAIDVLDIIDENGAQHNTNRPGTLLEVAPDGSKVRIWLGIAIPYEADNFFHPKHLLKDIVDNVGVIKSIPTVGGSVEEYAEKILLPTWENYTQWQADTLNYLIESQRYEVVFSHLHNIDLTGHLIWRFAKQHEGVNNDPIKYRQMIEAVYQDTDKYVGAFLPLLDKGWTIILTSDHGFLCAEDPNPVLMSESMGINATVMHELGYTSLKTDENGNLLHEIDWANTKAVASRTCHIYINLKGRDNTGIVDPADKYDLEEQIISDLYSYRDHLGRRIIAFAMRNKEAALLGLSGPDCGDIIYMCAEGPNRGHGDTFPTAYGYFDTSASPIFIAAGRGIKQGYNTSRVIRQVDVTPTIAALLGVRMPEQCEGAPAYQIFDQPY